MKYLLISMLTVLFCACTKFPTKGSQAISQENLQRIQLNTSTKSEVQALVGKPKIVTTIQTAEGTRNLWTYFHPTMKGAAGDGKGISHTIMFNEQDAVIGITTTRY